MKTIMLDRIKTNIIKNTFLTSFFIATTVLTIEAASAATLTRGPYLQTETATSVIVRWRSDTATNSRVRLGTSTTNLNIVADNNQSTTEHIVQVSGLSPKTKYFYSIGSTTATLSGGDTNTFFSTAPVVGERSAFRAWVIGDAGTGSSGQLSVYNAYRSFTGSTPTSFWLQLGDNAYNSGTDSEFQSNLFNVYGDMLRQSATWPTLGNHDGFSANSAAQTGPYYDIFSLPKNAEAGGVASGTEAYYAFDYANVHFVVLDSYETDRSVGAPMYTWLESDLQATSADWVVAVWHHPPYSKGSHNSDTETELVEMRKNYLPLLDKYSVDLVLSGHSHAYERSKLIDGHYGVSNTFNAATHVKQAGSGRVDNGGAYNKTTTGLAHAGTVYAVAGSSGQTSGGSLNHPAMFISINELGSMVLDVDGLTLNAKFINGSGTTRDYFTMTKGGGSALGRINGLAWKDDNVNGIRETGETLLTNIEAQLFNSSNQLVTTAFTDNAGAYRFDNLAAGNYSIQFVKGAYTISPKDQGSNDTMDSDVNPADGKTSAITLAAGATVNNVDIGLFTATVSSSSSKASTATTSSSAASVNSSANSSFTTLRVQAENFTSQLGTQTETTTDTGGGSNIGFIENGDYAQYDVTVPTKGNYKVQLRVASATTGGTISLEPANLAATSVNVAGTGGWQTWATVMVEIPLNAGTQTLRLNFKGGSGYLFNLNWFDISFVSSTVSSSSQASSSLANSSAATTRIQAENFTSQSGTQTETTTDTGGGSNIGFIENGDFAQYDVTVPTKGTYKIQLRVASATNGGSISLEPANLAATSVNVAGTGGWQTWTTVMVEIPLNAGTQTLRLNFKGGSGYLFNLNWFDVTFVSSTVNSTRVEAESFTSQSGTQTETTTDTGGGSNVGYISKGDFTEYKINIATAGTYNIQTRVASATNGGTINVLINNAALASIAVKGTGGWQTWTTLSTTANLSAGEQTLRLNFDGGSGDLFNINWLDFTLTN
jgi:acid phosphatase type 7